MPDQATGGTERYADPDEATCKYCGRSAERVVPEGTPFWQCSNKHGRLDDSEVLLGGGQDV